MTVTARGDDSPPPYPEDPFDADLQPPEDLNMGRDLHTHPGDIDWTPDNVAEPPLDYSEQWRSRPLPPLDEETVPTRQVTLSEAEIDHELFWAASRRAGLE